MSNVSTIINALGRPYLCEALKIKPGAVSAAAVANIFPSAWYPTIKRLAAEKGIEVPDHLFNWRRPEDVISDPKDPSLPASTDPQREPEPVTDNPASPTRHAWARSREG